MDNFEKRLYIQADYENYPKTIERFQNKFLEYPRTVSIETQVECNSRCVFCPYPNSPRKGQILSNDLFYKIIDDLCEIPKNHRFNITLHRLNEPLLDSRIRDFSVYIANRLPSAAQQFFTNGTMLIEDKFEWMADFQNSQLTVSLNSINDEEHYRMMGFRLKKVLNGLDYLHSLVRSKKFFQNVTLCAPFINKQQAEEYGMYCIKRWPLFKPAVRPFFEWRGGSRNGLKYRNNALLPDFDPLRISNYSCGQWFDLHILANGYVTNCCIDENGYADRQTFNVREYRAIDIYRQHRTLRLNLPPRKSRSVCRKCYHLG